MSGMEAVKKLIADFGLDEPGSPNLDGLVESDLKKFISVATRCPGQLGAVLFGEVEDREARRKTVESLHVYAQLSIQARGLRLSGKIPEALAAEKTMEDVYGTLPKWGKW